jgi:hypothetical protein
LTDERCGITKFGCNLAALWLEHIANDDPRSILFGNPARLPLFPLRVKRCGAIECWRAQGSEAGSYRDPCEPRTKWLKD